MSYRIRLSSAVLLVAAVVTALYWPGLGGSFFFDDEANILHVEGVQMQELSLRAVQDILASRLSGPSGRPVAQLSFALNHYLSGFTPFAFKATNLFIHLATGLLVFLLAKTLLGRTLPAGLLAAFWLLHPIQITPVLHVVQRMTSLSALFLFAAMLAHVRARERDGTARVLGLLLAWGLLWPLSFLSKETGVLFPLFALAWELSIRRRTAGNLDRFARLFATGTCLAVAACLAYLVSSASHWLWAGYAFRPFTLTERLLTEGRVLWFYLDLIAFPRLNAFGVHHDGILLSSGILSPWTTLPAWIGLAGLAWLAWRLRAAAPAIAFGIAWFLIGHLLESTVLPLEIAHEHRNYVPLFGLLLASASCFIRLTTLPDAPKGGIAALAVVALMYTGFVTSLRAHQFGDEIRRTQIEAQHHPASARAHFEAGRALAQRTESVSAGMPIYSFIRFHYERATELDPSFKFGLLGLAHLDCLAKRPPDRNEIAEMSRRLRETPFAPGDHALLHGLKEMSIAGTICLERPDIEAIFAAARENPKVTPQVRAKLHSWLADYLVLVARDLPAAATELDRSLSIVPHNDSNRLKRAQLFLLSGEREAAEKLLIALRGKRFATEEQKTLDNLLATLGLK